MIIGQGSIQIDENAKLVEDAADKAKKDGKDRERKFSSFMQGKITRSKYSPDQAGDTNEHQDGDMWTQINGDGTAAIGMWQYKDNKWNRTQWDSKSMSVEKLSALNADLGHVTAGQLDAVQLNSVEINVDMNGGTTYPHDGGHNPLYWRSNGFDINNPEAGDYSGFHFKNGLMSFKAERLTGPNGSSDGYDSTYIGPNDIKVRHTPYADAGFVNGRVDIRSNYIEISSSFDSGYTTTSGGSTQGVDGVGLYPDGGGHITTGNLQINSLSSNNSFESYATYNDLHGELHTYGSTTLDGYLHSKGGFTSSYVAYFDGGLKVTGNNSLQSTGTIYAENGMYVNNMTSFYPDGSHLGIGSGLTLGLNGNLYAITASNVGKGSSLSIKEKINQFDSRKALSSILGTDIYSYEYKGSNQENNYGPIIDDINNPNNVKYNVDSKIIDREQDGKSTWSLDKTLAMLMGSIQELSKENENLNARILKLEMKNYGNN